MKLSKHFLVLLSFLVIFAACDDDDDPTGPETPADQTIAELAESNENLTVLFQALQDANLAETLNGAGPFTVFAPTDDAFNALPPDVLSSLSNDELAQILSFHVVADAEIASTDLAPTQDVTSLLGEPLLVESDGGVTVNNTANVQQADVEASNGIVHVIDEVLLPSGFRDANIVDQAVELGSFTTLVDALDQTGLTTTLLYKGDFTVFAPTDDAFNSLPAGTLENLTVEQLTEILTYHVIPSEVFAGDLSTEQAVETLSGETVFITKDESGTVTINNGSTVVTADVDVSNGVIHAVDQVLLPDSFANVEANISKRFNLSTLSGAIETAGLQAALQDGQTEFTIFAPLNSAFADLPAGTLESLTTDQLADILSFHVIAGNTILAEDLAETQDVESLLGEDLLVETDGSQVTVNNSAIVETANIEGTNGVIHIIDGVLLPRGFRDANIVDQAIELGSFATLVDAVDQVGLTTTLQFKGDFTVFAPTDQAFANLPAGTLESLTDEQLTDILTYHVLPSEVFAMDLNSEQTVAALNGDSLFITKDGSGTVTINNGSTVVTADVDVSNGVIHAIDGVLLPDSFNTVTGIVGKRYTLSTLSGALESAALDDDLNAADGTFTLFAPTNAAFDALSSIPSGSELESVLLYHVLDSIVLSGDLSASQTVTTLNGADITITVENNVVSINGEATVTIADIEGTNGVVHVIDAVLIPPSN